MRWSNCHSKSYSWDGLKSPTGQPTSCLEICEISWGPEWTWFGKGISLGSAAFIVGIVRASQTYSACSELAQGVRSKGADLHLGICATREAKSRFEGIFHDFPLYY